MKSEKWICEQTTIAYVRTCPRHQRCHQQHIKWPMAYPMLPIGQSANRSPEWITSPFRISRVRSAISYAREKWELNSDDVGRPNMKSPCLTISGVGFTAIKKLLKAYCSTVEHPATHCSLWFTWLPVCGDTVSNADPNHNALLRIIDFYINTWTSSRISHLRQLYHIRMKENNDWISIKNIVNNYQVE